ncbi:hypothetical protein O3660_01340 [Neisseria sp. 27098_8_139]
MKPVDNILPSDLASCFVGLVQIVQYDCAAEPLAVFARAKAGNRAPVPVAYITPPAVVFQ